MKITVVTSLYRSEKHLVVLLDTITAALRQITKDYEIIVVNDGSPDNSLKIAIDYYKVGYTNLKIIDLSRNFGQHKALFTALKYSKGDIVFIIDSDLEEDPMEIVRFFNLYQNQYCDADVVYGIQKRRKGNFLERVSGNLFYWLFNKISNEKVVGSPTPFRLMTRRYVDALISFQEKELFFLGISLLTGFKQVPVSIDKKALKRSSYNFRKKVSQFLDAITSFTNRPLIYVFYTGVLVFFISILYLIKIIYQFFFLSISVPGWASIVASIWFIGGIIIMSIGVIGIYISKIFLEIKNRPLTIIKKIYE